MFVREYFYAMITFDSISKQYGGTLILDNASFAFSERERTGLIGVNGSGKTTLLRILYGSEEPDHGTISKPSGMKIGYLPQEVEQYDDKTALEIVLEPFAHLLEYEKHFDELSRLHEQGNTDALRLLDDLHSAMELHDAYTLQARAESILSGLGITAEKWLKPTRELSGGYKMRAVLGQLLLSAPDFLLLDEPTNHLDMDSLVWLEKYLVKLQGGMLIVSHDRDFLNRITTCTAGINGAAITVRTGNYDQYIRISEETAANDANRARNLALQIAQNERFVERFKAKATKATQAQSRMKLIEKLRAEMPDLPSTTDQRGIRFSFPVPQQSGSVPIQLNGASTGYNGTTIINNVSLNVNRGDKIAIIGPNGAGKTTLLKLFAGILHTSTGAMELGTNVNIRYFGQHQLDQLDPNRTLYDTVMRDSVNTEKTFIRNILGTFLFSGDAVDKTAGVLSGGEKARLVLATILASPGNVLLLDEPTNHLDIKSIEMLADAMADFTGTIIFVSHDEYFVSRIATRIIEMRPGVVRDFPGTLADYRYYIEKLFSEEQSQEKKELGNRTAVPPVDEKAARLKQREEKKKLQRQIEKSERLITETEETIASLDKTLNDPANALNHALLHETTINLEAANTSLEKLMDEWERLQGEL